MGEPPIKINTRVARPFLVLYQRANNRWYIFAGKSQEEADQKAMRLLMAGRVKSVIVCKAIYDATLPKNALPPDNE